jgi:DNA-binding CsgD family transcriptional regulator
MLERPSPTYHEDLARAASPSAVCELVLAQVRERVSVSGLNVVAFGSVAEAAPHAALYQRDNDPEQARRYTATGLERLLADPKLPDLFAQPGCQLRVEEALGWENWLRSETYQEHFRHTQSARQLVVGFRDCAGAPRGFMAVCRSEAEPAFDAREQEVVLACRADAERALATFAVFPEAGKALDTVLDALTTAMPLPALLVAAGGRVLWMNREAELRLGMMALTVSRQRFYAATTNAMKELVGLAMRELAEPGAFLALSERDSRPAWLAPGEGVVARRFEARGTPASVLVCIQAMTAPAARDAASLRREYRLSAREADIALLAAEGYSVLAIAHQLGIAESTVGSHLKRLYSKLQVRSRVELARRVGAPKTR